MQNYHDEILLGLTCEEFDARYPEWHVALHEETRSPTK